MIRNTKIDFWVNDEEYMLIRQKMIRSGVNNLSAFLRKMAIDGYIVRLDISEVREMISAVNKVGNNINQIARRANGTGRVYIEDLNEIRRAQDQIYRTVNSLAEKIAVIK